MTMKQHNHCISNGCEPTRSMGGSCLISVFLFSEKLCNVKINSGSKEQKHCIIISAVTAVGCKAVCLCVKFFCYTCTYTAGVVSETKTKTAVFAVS